MGTPAKKKKVGFRIEFLGEFEAICETVLAHESEPCGLIEKKTEGLKSRGTAPLSQVC
jgi:hypothetical protein